MTNHNEPPIHVALIEAAQAVIDRWDSPAWKDLPATADYIHRLRKAIAAMGDASTRKDEEAVRPGDTTSPAQPCEFSLLTPEGIEAELLKDSRYLHEPLTGNERKLLRDTLALLRPYLRTTEPVSGARIQQERDFLFDLAVSTDANRICDRNEKINFEEQLVRSKSHVEYLMKGVKYVD